MELVELVSEALIKVVTAGQSRIMTSAVHGIASEGWLKLELINAIPGLDVTISPELNHVDIVLDAQGQRVYLELKAFPTNYKRGGGPKPITDYIDSICEDLDSLSRNRKQDEIGVAIWMAYIIPSPEPYQWPGHVAKVEAHAAETVLVERIPLWQDDFFAHLYISRSY